MSLGKLGDCEGQGGLACSSPWSRKEWDMTWPLNIINIHNYMYIMFLGSKITADGDCSHKIKIHLLLGTKVMTNLDRVLKSREINLLRKVCIVKALFFPVVMC